MNIFHLPSGKFVNPAHIEAISVHAHFWDSTKFYVQLSFKDGGTEDIEEKLDHDRALALRDEYVRKIREAVGEIDTYQQGHEDGYERGRSQGYEAGKADGYNTGYATGVARAQEAQDKRFLSQLYEFREELIKEQRSGAELPPNRRRYLRNSISAITDIIERLSSAALEH